MKLRISLLLLPFMFLSIHLMAQAQEGEFLKVDYLYVDMDNEDQFLGQLLTSWKNSQLERIDSEEITGWRIYHVRFDGNRNHNYNYVSITTATSMYAFEGQENSTEVAELHSSRRSHSDVPTTSLSRTTHSELWRIRNSVSQENESSPARFKLMDYMDVGLGREYEYQMFEDEIARPLHEARMESDRMKAWELYELVVPGGINYGYNFATGNFFKHLEHMQFGFTEEMIRANHPDVNMMEFFQTIYSTRDHVERSLWELVEYVQ